MKDLVVLFVALITVSYTSAQFKITETTKVEEFKKNEELSAVLVQAESLFILKVNAFRKEKKMKELKTHNAAELMALNHTMWMRQHKKLTHSQKIGSHFFSGSTLLKRLEFVDKQSNLAELGENVAYIDLTTENLNKTEEELSKLISEEFFDTWKNSPPHRENMLDKAFDLCGVSFLKSGMRIYGTHVFAARGQ